MTACPNELEREHFLAGVLSPELAEQVRLHVVRCAECREHIAAAQEEEALLNPLREIWHQGAHTGSGPAPDLPGGVSPNALPRYRIGALIGTGGMGLVYAAEQLQPRREVALKLMRPGLSTERMLQRFEFEAEVLGRLDHPGIARIYEAGQLGEGSEARPFFSMELVRGEPLTQHVRAKQLSLEARLQLFVRVCQAVQHAHLMGVVHRDLKPSNVLVTAAGEPKVLDFGVARVTGGDLSPEALTTRAEHFEGTLAYASPEQVAGGSASTDVRSDVYALGVLFYELLSDKRPLDLAGLPIDAAVRTVRETLPRPLGRAASHLSGDLETIASKALEKEPSRRYASAGDFAADVGRFLSREPIAARPATALYHLRRFCQRNFPLVASAALVFLALAAALVVSLVLKEEARRGRDNVLRLSAFRELRELERRAELAWPLHPSLVEEYLRWLEDAGQFVAGLEPDPSDDDPGHYAQRNAIRARALPSTSGSLGVAAAEPVERYRFEDAEDAWWHEQLDQLIGAIESFAAEETGLVAGVSPTFGWGVQQRLAWARVIHERSVGGQRAKDLWRAAIDSISNEDECPAYQGLQIEPQLGLLPLARNAASGLWEFAHVLSGVPHGEQAGSLVFDSSEVIVLVLIPGGTFTMGAQAEDPSLPGYDPNALWTEGPVHSVSLSPFFLGKCEVAQGQWLRLAGSNPSVQGPTRGAPLRPDLLDHPVENVSWTECRETLERFGLTLPTEAQWEYAARGQATTPWWTGSDPALLAGAANLADETCRRESRSLSWVFESWEDGYHQHAPVDSLRPNAFGLHHVSGNVWEWCADGHGSGRYTPGPASDPWTPPSPGHSVHARGGSWNDPAVAARVTIRNAAPQTYRGRTMGVRAARRLELTTPDGYSPDDS